MKPKQIYLLVFVCSFLLIELECSAREVPQRFLQIQNVILSKAIDANNPFPRADAAGSLKIIGIGNHGTLKLSIEFTGQELKAPHLRKKLEDCRRGGHRQYSRLNEHLAFIHANCIDSQNCYSQLSHKSFRCISSSEERSFISSESVPLSDSEDIVSFTGALPVAVLESFYSGVNPAALPISGYVSEIGTRGPSFTSPRINLKIRFDENDLRSRREREKLSLCLELATKSFLIGQGTFSFKAKRKSVEHVNYGNFDGHESIVDLSDPDFRCFPAIPSWNAGIR